VDVDCSGSIGVNLTNYIYLDINCQFIGVYERLNTSHTMDLPNKIIIQTYFGFFFPPFVNFTVNNVHKQDLKSCASTKALIANHLRAKGKDLILV